MEVWKGESGRRPSVETNRTQGMFRQSADGVE
jgi:hypothetical protein